LAGCSWGTYQPSCSPSQEFTGQSLFPQTSCPGAVCHETDAGDEPQFGHVSVIEITPLWDIAILDQLFERLIEIVWAVTERI